MIDPTKITNFNRTEAELHKEQFGKCYFGGLIVAPNKPKKF
jgi:hypothetical protein